MLHYLACFHLLPGITHGILKQIHQKEDDLERIWNTCNKSTLIEWGVKKTYLDSALAQKSTISPLRINEVLEKHSIQLHTITETWCDELAHIHNPPYLVYSHGNIPHTSPPWIAVVGSRQMTTYGKTIVEHFIKGLSRYSLPIISGFAQGVDQWAHHCALQYNSPTIAVIGAGLDRFLKRHPNAAIDCALSDFPLGTPPNRTTYPQRNRLISGLSIGTIVVEAKAQSGTNITARFACEQGKEVWVPCGNIFSEHMAGSHHIIKSGTGALVTSPDDIITSLLDRNILAPPELSESENTLFNKLLHFKTIDSMVNTLGYTALVTFTALEEKGYAQQTATGYIKLLRPCTSKRNKVY